MATQLINRDDGKFNESLLKDINTQGGDASEAIPPLRVMVATVKCEEIVSRQLRLLQSDQDWLELQENAKNHLVKEFGEKTSLILDASLSKYDEESMNLEESVTKDKRQFLMSEALKVIRPAYSHTLGHIRFEAQRFFKTQLKESGTNFSEDAVQKCHDSCVNQFAHQCSEYTAIKQANWEDDVSNARRELRCEINQHAIYQLQDQLSTSVTLQMSKVVDNPKDVWDCIRREIKRESERGKSMAIDIFEVEKEEAGQIADDFKLHAANRVETNFKDKSGDVLKLMNIKFIIALAGSNSMTKEEAYRQSLEVLSTMAVIRLDEKYDHVRNLLHSGLMDGDRISTDSLSSDTWEEVPEEKTLITPNKCRDIWNEFKQNMESNLAKSEEMQREKKEGWWPLRTCAAVGCFLGSIYIIYRGIKDWSIFLIFKKG